MAAVAPSEQHPAKRSMSVFASDAARASAMASTTAIMPNWDGSFVVQQPHPSKDGASTPIPKEEARLRRVSSEVDHKTRANDASHYDRSENSSAFVSTNEKFASLAHLVSAMNPLGMETRAKTANHDAIVRHFQLRRVSGEASRASYAKDDHDNDGLGHGPQQQDVDDSLHKLFVAQRLKQTPKLTDNHHDSLRNLNRDKDATSEIAVTRGSVWQRLYYGRRRLWRRCRSAARACSMPMSPTGTIASLRTATMLALVVVQLFLAPFAPVYFSTGSQALTAMVVLLDVVFFVDVLLGFNISFYDDKTDRIERDRLKVVRRFVSSRRRRWLIIDFLSAVPIEGILLLMRQSRENNSLLQPILSGDIASAGVRLLRWQSLAPHTIWGVRMLRATSHLRVRLNFQRYAHVAHAARVIVIFIGVVHYVACLWRASISDNQQHLDPDPWSTYILDLSTSVELLFGHSDRHKYDAPSPSPVFGLVAMVSGAFVMAYVTSSAALLLLRVNSNSSRYDTKLASVLATMDKLQLPEPLQRRIHQYYDHLWVAHDATDTSEIAGFSKALSSSLSLEVNLFKYMDLVLSVPFWRNCSADFVTQIMLNLQVRTYLPEDYIMRQGEIGDNLFVINRGVCELRARVAEDGKTRLPIPRMRRMNAGTAFGELALLMNYRRTATVRAVTFVEMCILERPAFQTILTRYRDDRREVLREMLVSSIEKKTQRFLPFPYEPLLEQVVGTEKIPTPWEAAEILVDMILAPDLVDDSVKFGFKDLDSFAQNQLIPVATPSPNSASTTRSPSPGLVVNSMQPELTNPEAIMKRLDSMEQWQVETTKRLDGLEQGMQAILTTLTSLTASLNDSSAHSPFDNGFDL